MKFSFLRSTLKCACYHFFTATGVMGSIVTMAIATSAEAQVRERSSNWIRGVAYVSLDRGGNSQITFNPRRCRELGPELCEFFRTHEYGHVNLRHLERGVPAQQAEAEADRWAAQNASPTAVQAARNYFLSGKGGSRIHGSPQERARRLSAGAMTTTTVTTANQRARTTAPKRYSATSKRIIRYVAKPATTKTKGKPVVVRSSSSSQQTSKVRPTSPTAQTVRYVVRPTTQQQVMAGKKVVVRSSSSSQQTPKVRPTSQPSPTVRYVVKPTPQRQQVIRRAATGYVPRGDFLNPR